MTPDTIGQINRLCDERAQAVGAARKLIESIDDTSKTELTAEEQAAYDAAMQDATRLSKRIDQLHALDEAEKLVSGDEERPMPRKTTPDYLLANAGGPGDDKRGVIEYTDAYGSKRTVQRGDPDYGLFTDDYLRAVRDYCRPDGPVDQRTLRAGSLADGGFMLQQQLSNTFVQELDDALYMMQLATVERLAGAINLGMVGLETDPSDAEWTSEVRSTDVAADSAMKFSRRELSPSPLVKRIDISRKLLNASARPEQIVMQRGRYKIALPMEKAFLAGSGANQPLGLFVADANGISTDRDVVTGAATNITADKLKEGYYGLKMQYRARGSWFIHRNGVAKLAALREDGSSGQFLWRPGLVASEPSTLLGHRVYETEHAGATWTNGQYVAVFGDPRYYHIAISEQLGILRDPLTAAGQSKVRFYFYADADGMPTLESAYIRFKCGT